MVVKEEFETDEEMIQLVLETRAYLNAIKSKLEKYKKEKTEFTKEIREPLNLNSIKTDKVKQFIQDTEDATRLIIPLLDNTRKIINKIMPPTRTEITKPETEEDF